MLVIHKVDSFVLKDAAELVYREMSDGIYFVEKHREIEFYPYVESKDVIASLNSTSRVYVSSKKTLYSNFEV